MSRYVIRPWRTVTGLVASGLMIAATVGCSPSSSEVTASEAGSVDVDVSPLTVRDPWVKAADEGMTAAFGVLSTTETPTSPWSARILPCRRWRSTRSSWPTARC